MNDKDSPLDGLFNGKRQIMIFPQNDTPKESTLFSEVIAYATELVPSQQEDDMDVNNAITKGNITFRLNNVDVDSVELSKVLGVGVSPTESTVSVTIESMPYINRPCNLKYPNKKRARRIWKKWRKRFGVRGNESLFFIPKARIVRSVEFNNDGVMIFKTHITGIK